MIETINLNKRYRHGKITVPAVCDVNLKINSGEIVSLFGRSGSGKTTLLNLIGTLINQIVEKFYMREKSSVR